MSTPTTDTEFTGEENPSTAQTTEEHPPYQHLHADGTYHYSNQPDCGGLCPDRTDTAPPPPQEP